MKVNIILIIGTLFFISCQTMTLTEMIANDILHYINNRNNKSDYSYTNSNSSTEEDEELEYPTINLKIKEVRKVEDLNQITASIGSVIAGIYCIVKTIIAIVKKQKKN